LASSEFAPLRLENKVIRILITGGSGFIGTNLVDHFAVLGHTVINLDGNVPRKKEHQVYWRNADLLNAQAVTQIVKEFLPTHVVHLAARTDLNGKQLSDYKVNTLGTNNLLAALAEIQTVQRAIFASSMLVCRPGYIPTGELDFSTATIYGESKKEMELLIRKKNLLYDWLIIRPTSMWGPWFQTPYKDFFDRVIAKRMFNIRNRSCTKTCGFVLNGVVQIEKLLFAKEVEDKVYYIGDTPPLNVFNWTNDIAAALRYKKPPSFPYYLFKMAAVLGDILKTIGINFPMSSFRLKNMTTNNILPLDNLYKVTGAGTYSLEEAIQITLNWMKNNK
jgi:nucleoside-diphosphate-sugar epimerase